MVIGFVSTMDGCPWGGSEELWSQAAARLVSQGLEVTVNVLRWPETVAQIERLREQGCRVEQRDVRAEYRLSGRISRRLRRVMGLRPSAHWLDQTQPDLVVISQGSHADGLPWMLECAERQIPYAVIVQCVDEGFWPDDAQAAKLRLGYERAQASFFLSRKNLEFVRAQFAVEPSGVRTIHNPFNLSYDAAPPWPAAQGGVFRLACVARLEPRAKGQDLLLQTLSREHWRRRPLHLTLFGKGPAQETLEALTRLYKLENVTLGGYASDIEALWAEHHALVLPSRMEGLPLSLVEAMLCGRPAIVTDVAGNAEAVEDNVSGFVATAPTVDLLDEALERAWSRRDEWPEMGSAAAARIRTLIPRDPVGEFTDAVLALLPQAVSRR